MTLGFVGRLILVQRVGDMSLWQDNRIPRGSKVGDLQTGVATFVALTLFCGGRCHEATSVKRVLAWIVSRDLQAHGHYATECI